jgi:hypothetical protein
MKPYQSIGLRALLAGLALFAACTGAHAQATRTWVSGVGDDANPCSRTAPCKTFAGAIAKTAAGGMINVIDAGGFGAVTITKSITIDGGGFPAGISATNTTGVVVNGTGIEVVLRNLQISGAPSAGAPTVFGVNGVRLVNGASLHIENCHIIEFKNNTAGNGNGNGNGVMVDTSAAGTHRLYIDDSTIENNGWGSDGGGVRLRPTGASTFVFATIRNSRIVGNNGYGVLSRDRTFVSIDSSNISGNLRSGVNLLTTGTLGETVVRGSFLADNGSVNAGSEAGVTSNGSASIVSITGNSIIQSENGVRRLNSGHIRSSGDNTVAGNTADGTTDGSVTSL